MEIITKWELEQLSKEQLKQLDESLSATLTIIKQLIEQS